MKPTPKPAANSTGFLQAEAPGSRAGRSAPFCYFSYLTNLASRHRIRCTAASLTRDPGEEAQGSLDLTFKRLTEAGIPPEMTCEALKGSLVSPVLAASQWRCARRGVLDGKAPSSTCSPPRGLERRARPQTQRVPDAGPGSSSSGKRGTCGSLISPFADEIENALRFYQSSFLQEIPHLYANLEEGLGMAVPRFLQMGSWIGGDRDGNPNVNVDTLVRALRRQCEVALGHYLRELNELRVELPMSSRLVDFTPELHALADGADVSDPHREDEPYRRALVGMYSRLALTLEKLTNKLSPRRIKGRRNLMTLRKTCWLIWPSWRPLSSRTRARR